MSALQAKNQPPKAGWLSGARMLLTKEGDVVTWIGQGIGRFTGPGSVSWRGALYYRTSSERRARLNGTIGVYEFETDQEGNIRGKAWKWK